MNAMQFKDGYVNKVFSQKIGQEGKNEYYIGLYCDCDCCHWSSYKDLLDKLILC